MKRQQATTGRSSAQRDFASKLSKWSIGHGIRYRTVLADELEVPRPRVNAWFKGVMPSRPYLQHLAEVTGDDGFLRFRQPADDGRTE